MARELSVGQTGLEKHVHVRCSRFLQAFIYSGWKGMSNESSSVDKWTPKFQDPVHNSHHCYANCFERSIWPFHLSSSLDNMRPLICADLACNLAAWRILACICPCASSISCQSTAWTNLPLSWWKYGASRMQQDIPLIYTYIIYLQDITIYTIHHNTYQYIFINFIQFSMFFPNLQRGGLQGQALGLCGELLLAFCDRPQAQQRRKRWWDARVQCTLCWCRYRIIL